MTMTITLNTMLTSIMKWHRRRTNIRALSALSDRTFKDIGLHRSEIQSVATELTSEMPGSRIMTHRNAKDSRKVLLGAYGLRPNASAGSLDHSPRTRSRRSI